jgi:hypothetical protein
MSYDGGAFQGPTGPTGATGPSGGPTGSTGPTGYTGYTGYTGPTGPSGGPTFDGPTGSVLWYDGSAVTGTTGLRWSETAGTGNAYRLFGGVNANFIDMDVDGSMGMTIEQLDAGYNILLAAGSTRITLTDATADEEPIAGNLQIQINGSNGNNGEVLTSDGTYASWQPSGSLPHGIVNLTDLTWSQEGTSGFYYSDFSVAPYTIEEGANVLTTMINAIDIQAAANCWIINVSPNISTGLVRIWLAGRPPSGASVDPLYASWLITDFGTAPPPQ